MRYSRMITSNFYHGMVFSDFVASTLLHETKNANWLAQTGLKITEKLGFEKCAFDTKRGRTIDTSQLTHENMLQPPHDEALLVEKVPLEVRSLIVSNNSNTLLGDQSGKRPKKTNNRKKVTGERHFLYGGVYYEINNISDKTGKAYGVYEPIMLRLIEQFDIAYQIHGKVLVMRFDISIDGYTADNKIITEFRKRLNQQIERDFYVTDIGYGWAREQERSKQQHYHFVLFLDGQKVWYHQGISKLIKTVADRSSDVVRVTFAGFHQVDCEDVFREAVYHFSYLAKTRGKGYRPPKTRDFSTSRLKIKEKVA